MPVSYEMEEKTWRDGILGEERGQQLVETVLFLLGVDLALHGGEEHKRLRRPGFKPQITVTQDSDGFKCFRFQEDPKGKTHQGGMSTKAAVPKVLNVYPILTIQQDAPSIFLKGTSPLLPKTMKNPSLYMHAKKKP